MGSSTEGIGEIVRESQAGNLEETDKLKEAYKRRGGFRAVLPSVINSLAVSVLIEIGKGHPPFSYPLLIITAIGSVGLGNLFGKMSSSIAFEYHLDRLNRQENQVRS